MSELQSSSGAPVIDVSALVRRYGTGRTAYEAVRGVDLRVERGELFALLGTNGAGKTSTVELIEGLARPSAGEIRVLGLDPYADRARLRPRIGIMLQHAGFPGSLCVQEMADLWRAGLPHPRPTGEVLAAVGLDHRVKVPIASLSGGEQRRLDLALALLGSPEVLFLDEPTTGLDPQSRRTTWDLISDLLTQGVTVLLTTHLLEEAEQLASRIAIMHQGRIAARGTVGDLIAQQPTCISFGLESDVDIEGLRRIAGAAFAPPDQRRRAHRHDRGERLQHIELTTFEPQQLLGRLLAWAEPGPPLRDLRVQPGSLERTFLEIAARPTTGDSDPATPQIPTAQIPTEQRIPA